MTARDLRERVAAALGEHEGSERGSSGAWCVKCYCGHDTPVEIFPGDAWDIHRAHLTDAVLRVVAEWLGSERAAAWDEGHRIGALDAANLAIWNHPPTPNPYRSALTATGSPTRPPGAPETPAGVSQDVRGAERGGER